MIRLACAHGVGVVASVLYVLFVFHYFDVRGGGPGPLIVLVGLLFAATAVAHSSTRRSTVARRLFWPLFITAPVCFILIGLLAPGVGRHIDGSEIVAISGLLWGAFATYWTTFCLAAWAGAPASR